MLRPAAEAILTHHGWLATAPHDLQTAILSACQLRHIKAGSSLFTLDQDPAGVVGLASGRVHMHLASGPDDPTLFAVVTPGYWFADLEAPPTMPRLVSAIAKQPCVILRLGGSAIRTLAHQDQRVAAAFTSLVTTNFATTLALLAVVRRLDIAERVAAMLCALAGADLADGAVVHTSQTELASMCGVGRTATAAALATLETEGLVTPGYAQIQITNAAALLAYCHLA